MNLQLSDEAGAALISELAGIVRNDRFPLSPRIQTFRAILAKIRPTPVREPLPPLKHYEPPSRADTEDEARLKIWTLDA